MIRKTIKTLCVALVALFTVVSMAEAAPKKVTRTRARHATRVTVGSTTSKKKTKAKKHHRKPSSAGRSSSLKQKPSTKPQ